MLIRIKVHIKFMNKEYIEKYEKQLRTFIMLIFRFSFKFSSFSMNINEIYSSNGPHYVQTNYIHYF